MVHAYSKWHHTTEEQIHYITSDDENTYYMQFPVSALHSTFQLQFQTMLSL